MFEPVFSTRFVMLFLTFLNGRTFSIESGLYERDFVFPHQSVATISGGVSARIHNTDRSFTSFLHDFSATKNVYVGKPPTENGEVDGIPTVSIDSYCSLSSGDDGIVKIRHFRPTVKIRRYAIFPPFELYLLETFEMF